MNTRDLRALVAVLLLPALATVIGLWSMAHRDDNFVNVPAAVVNLDKGATMVIDGEEKFVPIGRILAGALTDPLTSDVDAVQSLHWELVAKDEADEGLKNGTYEAVITIPQNFSATLSQLGTPQASPATIEVASNQASSYVMGRISEQIGDAAASTLGNQLTKQMLDKVFIGFSDISQKLDEAVDGAKKLAEGTEKLHTGSEQLHEGTTRLSKGAHDLSDGTQQLYSGANTLAQNTSELHAGAQKLADGAKNLHSGTSALHGGAHTLFLGASDLFGGTQAAHSGSGQLADGALAVAQGNDQLYDGAQKLEDGTKRLKDGADQLYEGQKKTTQGAKELNSALDRLTTGSQDIATGTNALRGATQQAADGSQELYYGLLQLGSGLSGSPATPTSAAQPGLVQLLRQLDIAVNNGQPEISLPSLQQAAVALEDASHQLWQSHSDLFSGLQNLESGVDNARQAFEHGKQKHDDLKYDVEQLALQCPASGAQLSYCVQLGTKLTEISQASEDSSKNVDTLLSQLEAALKPSANSPGLVKGSQQFHNGLEQLKDGAHQLRNAIDSPDPHKPGIAQITPLLVAGATQMQDGLDGVVQPDGSRKGGLIDGAYQLMDGTSVIHSGVSSLDSGTQALASGTQQAHSGSLRLVTGLDTLTDGSRDLAEGAKQAHGATVEFVDGSARVYDGAHELHRATLTLQNKMMLLNNGASQLRDGTLRLSSSTAHLDEGAFSLSLGANQLADGTELMQTGTSDLSAGAAKVNDGAQQLKHGSDNLEDGASQLHDATKQLKDGSVQLADAMREGQDALPVYDDSQRAVITQTGAQPVTTRALHLNKSVNGATSSFSLTMVLMAWLGAFAIFLLMPALRRTMLDAPQGAFTVMWRSLWPGLAIGLFHIVTIIIIGFGFGIHPKYGLQACLFMLLIGATFMTVHQMFLALFGNRLGRILSLLFFIIQGASLSGILPIETAPSLFQTLNGFLPMSLGSQGLQHYILGGHTVDSGWMITGLLLWCIGSISAVVLSVPRWRTARFQRELHQVSVLA
ncbi:MAG: YhgE/Pip domain-containing protein [Actinomycetaceae bacterium]|nr:YhgE/Pip domain-containing protein [Actinomycetaceae bacterium]